MTEAEAKVWNPVENVISACDVKHGDAYVALEFINGFWRCPTCNKRAFENYLTRGMCK